MTGAELVVNVQGGARIALSPRTGQTTTYILLEQEDWFEDEIRFLRRWLKPGMQAIDVGANVGVYTAAMTRAAGPRGRVWAFEPAPATAELLQRTVELNEGARVVVVRAAVSDASGSVRLALGERSEENAVVTAQGDAQETITVPAVSLDEAARRHGWDDIDLLKIDIEGHEPAAIAGARKFLSSNSPLLMLEINTTGSFHLDALSALEDMGYVAYRLLPGPLILVPFDRNAMDPLLLNVFACKIDRARRLAAEGYLVERASGDLPQASNDAWAAYARTAPYCTELAPKWQRKAGLFSAIGEKSHQQALAAFAMYRERDKPAAERYGWLVRALDCAGEALGSEDSVARRVTYARAALEFGERGPAAQSLQWALERLGGENDVPREAFLAPSERYERLPALGRAAEWLRCAVTEVLEKRRGYSSWFDPSMSLSLLEPILDLPFRSAETERRWQLARMALGKQTAPQASSLLCRGSDENLNPEFWCGAGPIS